jgi:glycine cleavage system transcriptional repressor
MSDLVVTAIGKDRPGLVGELTGELFSLGANIIETRMVNLRGQFALMLLLELADDKRTKLDADLPTRAKAIGLAVHLSPQEAAPAPVRGLSYTLRSYSIDQPGIIARLSAPLRAVGANIEELSARQESAPFAGEPIFIADFRLTVPSTVHFPTLRAELEKLAGSLNCDIDLQPMT